MTSFLSSNNKKQCFGCEACKQICPRNAITMVEDKEGFRYPSINKSKCINCGLCNKVCYFEKPISKSDQKQYAFGGYNKNWNLRCNSTSGGAFSAIVKAFCDENYAIFGATASKLEVYHTFITDKNNIGIFQKSKYLQSKIGDSYKQAKELLMDGKKVLFSGTPCQIAGLKEYLLNFNTDKLLTVEVICEGVPTPLYIKKLDEYLFKKYKSNIENLDYRYKDSKRKNHGKWDFQVMQIKLKNNKTLKKDRWFNPFWNIWLDHLMSRPSCYECPFTTKKRVADITLGDLWGVHIYCPELYGHNGGSSLIISNTKKGEAVLKETEEYMYGHYLDIDEAIKYQSPMRKSILYNEKRQEFFDDILNKDFKYENIVKKWYKKPSLKLLFKKYIYGNRQRVFLWNIKNKGRDVNERND